MGLKNSKSIFFISIPRLKAANLRDKIKYNNGKKFTNINRSHIGFKAHKNGLNWALLRWFVWLLNCIRSDRNSYSWKVLKSLGKIGGKIFKIRQRLSIVHQQQISAKHRLMDFVCAYALCLISLLPLSIGSFFSSVDISSVAMFWRFRDIYDRIKDKNHKTRIWMYNRLSTIWNRSKKFP